MIESQMTNTKEKKPKLKSIWCTSQANIFLLYVKNLFKPIHLSKQTSFSYGKHQVETKKKLRSIFKTEQLLWNRRVEEVCGSTTCAKYMNRMFVFFFGFIFYLFFPLYLVIFWKSIEKALHFFRFFYSKICVNFDVINNCWWEF